MDTTMLLASSNPLNCYKPNLYFYKYIKLPLFKNRKRTYYIDHLFEFLFNGLLKIILHNRLEKCKTDLKYLFISE